MERVDSFPEKRNPTAPLDWDKIFDGSIWKITCGTDHDANYKGKPESLRMLIYSKAKRREVKARVSVAENNVFVQRLGKN